MIYLQKKKLPKMREKKKKAKKDLKYSVIFFILPQKNLHNKKKHLKLKINFLNYYFVAYIF